MFQETIYHVGSADSRNWPHTRGKLTYEIKRVIEHRVGIGSIANCLLRGGFLAKRDLELLLRTGCDYEGRWPPSNGYATRSQPHTTIASPWGFIGSSDQQLDPLWNAVFKGKAAHSIALYDKQRLEMVGRCEYRFLNPKRKLEALAGVINIEFLLQ